MAASTKKVRRISDAVSLEQIPNVGKAMAGDLERLGIHAPRDLASADPKALYDALCALDGVRHDPCVLDVFMAAVDFAKGGAAAHWSAFTPERKAKWPGV